MTTDIDQMPDTPQRGSHHRRAQSESFLQFPDDLLLDPDLDLLDSMAIDASSKSESSNGQNPAKLRPAGPTTTPAMTAHFRSLSVDADFFENLGFSSSSAMSGDAADGDKFGGKAVSADWGIPSRPRHRHSNSMDGSITSSFEDDSVLDGVKKAMAPERLAELALIDPKRAKRILANRQSAARSKERKIRYTSELERKVQTLQTEATTLSAQVTMLQRDTTGLTSENKELKLRLQAMEQQAHLRDALNDTLREEVQRLKIATGHMPAVNGNNFNRMLPQFSSLHFGSHQTNQQQQPQEQMHMAQPNTNNQTPSRPPQARFSDFNHRI